jgi:hypothetical protein
MSDNTYWPVDYENKYPVEPQYLEFCEYGCMGDGNRLVWDPISQTLEIRDYSGEAATKVLPVPTRSQWKAFWILLDRARVWDWETSYVDETGICDGGGWKLDASYAGRCIKSSGYNAYPDSRGMHYLPGSSFDVFSAAILMLSNGQFPGLSD